MKITNYHWSVIWSVVLLVAVGFGMAVVGGVKIILPAILTFVVSVLTFPKKFRSDVLWGSSIVTNIVLVATLVWQAVNLGTLVIAGFASAIFTIAVGLVGFQLCEV